MTGKTHPVSRKASGDGTFNLSASMLLMTPTAPNNPRPMLSPGSNTMGVHNGSQMDDENKKINVGTPNFAPKTIHLAFQPSIILLT
jgi:hypothetical protein